MGKLSGGGESVHYLDEMRDKKNRMYVCVRACVCIPPVVLRPNVGHGLLILEVSRSHTTHHSR